MNLQQEQQQQQEQQPGGAGVNDRFNSGVSASGNSYAAQQNNNAYAQQVRTLLGGGKRSDLLKKISSLSRPLLPQKTTNKMKTRK